MICSRCGKQSNSASHICPYCGTYMGEERPLAHPSALPVYSEKATKAPSGRRKKRRPKRRSRVRQRSDSYYTKKHVINWAWVWFSCAVLAFFLMVGAYAYLKMTPNGQVILARMGRDASADALWTLGQEYLDRGEIPRSIQTYEKALQQEPERADVLEKLFLLSEAYEAAERPDKALEMFTRIYKEAKGDEPTRRSLRVQGYRNSIRLLDAQGYTAQATDLMRTAYEDTGDVSFYKERSQLVPRPPTASLPGGRHMFTQKVSFLSEQGYDIYYAMGDEILPEEGTLYKEPIVMTEGVYTFRAICLSQDLMSDEMTVKYTITLPVPMAPRANVQPGEHNRPFKVRLRNVGDDPDVRMYYTVDGSRPTEQSPEFTGEGIQMPVGRVFLRAIAVNQYGKVSNEMIMDYKIKGVPKKQFSQDDRFDKFTLMKTTKEQFIAAFGAPTAETEGKDELIKGTCTTLTYPWGEARFSLMDAGNLMYYIDTREANVTAPRKTRVGMALSEVTQQYRDMGQPQSPNGDRGLYYNATTGYGAYTVLSDNPQDGKLEYCYLEKGVVNPGTNLLTYHITGGRVTRITYLYSDIIIPNNR